jgi:CRP/FNR family transcriptional regulator
MSGLALKQLNSFFSKFREISFKKGELLLNAGDEPQGVYYLKQGYVRMYAVSKDGKELSLNIYKPGSYFPVIWALGNMQNRYYFEAKTDLTVCRVPKDKFIDFLEGNHKVLMELVTRLSVGLGGISGQMEYMFFGSACNRISSVILIAAKRFGKKENKGEIFIDLQLTHQDIADLAGLARETASVEIKKLERLKIIFFRKRHIVVRNFKKLEERSLIESIDVSSSGVG